MWLEVYLAKATIVGTKCCWEIPIPVPFVTAVQCQNGDVAFDGTRGTRCEDPAGSSTGQHQPANESHGSVHGGAPCNALAPER